MEYTFIRSKRKTIGITIKPDGSVILRAPLRCPRSRAEAFLLEKRDWIEKSLKKIEERRAKSEVPGESPALTESDIKALKKQAKIIIPPLVEAYAKEMGVTYGTISIRAQKSRWGSCSADGNLSFNCFLMLLPENLLRYVIVHELCHRREMNHSKAFWALVERYRPTYREERKELKEKFFFK